MNRSASTTRRSKTRAGPTGNARPPGQDTPSGPAGGGGLHPVHVYDDKDEDDEDGGDGGDGDDREASPYADDRLEMTPGGRRRRKGGRWAEK